MKLKIVYVNDIAKKITEVIELKDCIKIKYLIYNGKYYTTEETDETVRIK